MGVGMGHGYEHENGSGPSTRRICNRRFYEACRGL